MFSNVWKDTMGNSKKYTSIGFVAAMAMILLGVYIVSQYFLSSHKSDCYLGQTGCDTVFSEQLNEETKGDQTRARFSENNVLEQKPKLPKAPVVRPVVSQELRQLTTPVTVNKESSVSGGSQSVVTLKISSPTTKQ